MDKSFLITFLFCVCSFFCFGQRTQMEQYISDWGRSDTSQTHRAEISYAWLKAHKAPVYLPQHRKLIRDLYVYLKAHPSERLEVRIAMYEILGKCEHGIPRTAADARKTADCIRIAHKLKDEQLKAELYALYAETVPGSANYILYNLKAIELQRKIGFQHFKYVHNRFFNTSLGLYQSNNYQQSISYGLQCLAFKDVKKNTWDPRVYIFQLDIIGASYLKIGKYDSARYYYQQIIDTLSRKPDPSADVQTLWMGIAKGNIGHAFLLQGKEKEGAALVQVQLQNGIKVSSYNNMAMAGNILASIDFKHKRYQEALQKWKTAYQWALKSEYYVIEQKLLSLQGIVKAYKQLHVPDSAYKYIDLHFKVNAERNAEISLHKLSQIQARMRFDDMQANLESISGKLRQETLIRNFILGFIFLLTVISLLLYNRHRLKALHQEELLKHERAASEQEITGAKERIAAFTRHIMEKEKLIANLERTLNVSGISTGEKAAIDTNLLNYVLVTDQEWIKFRDEFSKAYPLFFIRLRHRLPQINPAEERLACLICLQLDNRQIANMLGISPASVGRSKRRLKQRISVPENLSLEDDICTLNGPG